MALSLTAKANVRKYLGYPDVNRQSYLELEGALDAISAEGEVVVTDLLTKLANVDLQLENSWSVQKVKRAEEVELFGGDGIQALWAEGRRLVERLAATLDVQVLRQVFGAGGGRGGQAGRG